MGRNSTSAADRIQYGFDILRTTVSEKTGKILLQLGNAIGKTVDSDNVEQVQQVGFVSRAPSAEAGKRAAQVVVLRLGDRDIAVNSIDLRGLELAGLLKDGETAIYAAGDDGNSQGRVLCKDDGSINAYTTHDNTKDGRSVYLRVAPDELVFASPWGTLRFDKTGFHVQTASGAALNLGGIAGLPAPLDAIDSYAKLSAGVVSTEAVMQANGVGGGTSLASAPAVLEAIAALQVEIAAVAASLVAVTNVPGVIVPGGPHAIAAGAGTAAVGVAAVALGFATPRIPTTTTSA